MTRQCLSLVPVIAVWAAGAHAQTPVDLASLQRAAVARDARAAEIDQLARQSDLRVETIDVDRKPSIGVLGSTQYQSDSTTAPFPLPDGSPAFVAPKFTYDASVRVEQRVYDPSLGSRVAVERATLAESQARVRTSLYSLRQEVNDAFFTAALMDQQLGALTAAIADLEGRLRDTTARVREGAALAGEAAAVEASLIRERQQADDLRATRSAALARLARLTGLTLDAGTPFALPSLDDAAARAREQLDSVRARPEYAQFARTRERVAAQQDATSAADRPQLSAYGRGGYGQPGLNMINTTGQWYALGGLQFQWKAWSWNASDHERAALALQRDIVAAEEAAFTDAVRRGVETDLATIDRLQHTADDDDRVVELRDAIDKAARARFAEGVTTAADYLDRRTEWLTAQFDRARHRVELAYAQARLLTTLGLEVQ
jgi:outer membrane protein TolC